MTSSTAQRTYDSLPEFYRLVDPSTGSILLSYIRAVIEGMGVSDADEDVDRFASALRDEIDTIPIAWVEWLAPLLGVQFLSTYTAAQKREATISATSGWRSGTIPALEEAVRQGITPVHASGTHLKTDGTGYYVSALQAGAQVDDIDLRVRTDGHIGTNESIVDAFTSGDGFALRAIGGAGGLSLRLGLAGGQQDADSTTEVPFGQYDVGWLRAVTEDSGGDKIVTFYTAEDTTTTLRWQQLGSPVTLAGQAGPIEWAGVTQIGVAGPSEIHAGTVLVEMSLLDGRDGEEVARFDATSETVGTAPTIADAYGHSWAPAGDAIIDQYPETPFVQVKRHYGGDPWQFGIVTSRVESPSDTSVIAAAIERANSRPAGFTVVFENYTKTWDEIEAAYPTWDDWVGETWSDIQAAGP